MVSSSQAGRSDASSLLLYSHRLRGAEGVHTNATAAPSSGLPEQKVWAQEAAGANLRPSDARQQSEPASKVESQARVAESPPPASAQNHPPICKRWCQTLPLPVPAPPDVDVVIRPGEAEASETTVL